MSKVVAKNALILTAVEVISKMVELAGFVFLARILGAEKYGLMNFAYTVGTMFCLLPHFGFDQLVVRDVSRQKELAGEYLAGITIVKVFLFLISLGMMAAWLELGSHFNDQRKAVVYAAFLGVFILSCIYFTSAFFRAFQKASMEAGIRITLAVLVMAVSITAVLITPDVLTLFIVRLLVSVIAFFLSVYLIVAVLKVDISNALRKIDLGQFLKKGWPFAVFIFFIFTYISIDIIMLTFMSGDKATGFYSVASKILIFFLIIPTGIANAVLPAMSERAGKDPQGFKFLADRSFRYVLILGVFCLMFNVLLGPVIIGLFFGDAFAVSGSILKLSAFMLIPAYLNHIGNTILLAYNREKMIVVFSACGAGLNILLNFMLIPSFSYFGAALATVLTECFIVAVQFIYIRRSVYSGSDFFQENARVLLTGVLLVLIMVLLPGQLPALSFLIACPAYVYFLFRSGTLSKESLMAFWKYLRNRPAASEAAAL